MDERDVLDVVKQAAALGAQVENMANASSRVAELVAKQSVQIAEANLRLDTLEQNSVERREMRSALIINIVAPIAAAVLTAVIMAFLFGAQP